MVIMRFIKKLVTVFSVGFLLILLVGCSGNRASFFGGKAEAESPPLLKVLYQDKSVKAIRGSFSWATKNKNGKIISAINADTVGPTELVKGSIPLTVSTKSILNLNFSDKPVNTTVNIWQGSEAIKQKVTDNKVITPESKGSVVYEVVADWDDGTACYAFLVNVD
jgi:hypothetical protein